MSETIESIKRKLWVYVVVTFLAFFVPLFAAFCPVLPEGEIQATWFQRSGSIMVILGAFIEFRLLAIDGNFDIHDAKYTVPFDLPKTYERAYKILLRLALVVIVLGTLIWGYGDIPFKNT